MSVGAPRLLSTPSPKAEARPRTSLLKGAFRLHASAKVPLAVLVSGSRRVALGQGPSSRYSSLLKLRRRRLHLQPCDGGLTRLARTICALTGEPRGQSLSDLRPCPPATSRPTSTRQVARQRGRPARSGSRATGSGDRRGVQRRPDRIKQGRHAEWLRQEPGFNGEGRSTDSTGKIARDEERPRGSNAAPPPAPPRRPRRTTPAS